MKTVLAFAERNVPRYTSYPTAPHFTPAVGAKTYREWLTDTPESATLSLYLHVPFCTSICFYCGCHTKAARRRMPVERYADRLIDEIRTLGAAIRGRRVVNIAWGGGTPSLLGEEWLAQIAAEIGRVFDLSDVREHAFELDPRRLTPELPGVLAAIGVNRASLGVQDFSPHVQEAIGRIQPIETVEQAMSLLRREGIARINIDLMYGLPRQTVSDVEGSAALAASLRPQRLALFGYAHVPWFKTHQRLIDEQALPGPAERLDQARAAAEILRHRGYQPIGLDHFADAADSLAVAARTDGLHRNFQGYTADQSDVLIGIGASAIGRLPQGFVQNAVDIGGYERAVAAGHLATIKGIALTDDDRLRGAIIERLMCYGSVDLQTFCSNPRSRFAAEIETLRPFVSEGFITLDDARIVVTGKGQPLIRLVAAAFDGYLAASRARHSIAV